MKAYLLFLLGSTVLLFGGLLLLIAIFNIEGIRYGFLWGLIWNIGMAYGFIKLLQYAERKQKEAGK